MRRTIILVTVAVLVVLAGVTGVLYGPKIVRKLTAVTTIPGMNLAELTLGAFPKIDETNLSETQKKVVALTKQEHAAQVEYTKYSEGNKEAWCADFASWIMKEAGVSYKNPNSGHWRIPGTLTLREYYEKEGRFKPVDSDYMPKVGDVILYDGAGWFGQHVNIVLAYENGKVTTVGGNEAGKVRVQTRPLGGEGTVGYGVLLNT